eukprot:g6009.t1
MRRTGGYSQLGRDGANEGEADEVDVEVDFDAKMATGDGGGHAGTAAAAAGRKFVKVKTLQDKTLEVELRPEVDTVLKLKEALAPLSGLAIQEMRLIFRGRFLDDAAKLGEAGVTQDTCLHLIRGPPKRSGAGVGAAGTGGTGGPAASGGNGTRAASTTEADEDGDRFLLGLDIEMGGGGGPAAAPFGRLAPAVHVDGAALTVPPHAIQVWQMRVRCLAFVILFRYGLGLLTSAALMINPAYAATLGDETAWGLGTEDVADGAGGGAGGLANATAGAGSDNPWAAGDGTSAFGAGGKSGGGPLSSESSRFLAAQALSAMVCVLGIFTALLGFKAAQRLELRLAHRFYVGLVILAAVALGAAGLEIFEEHSSTSAAASSSSSSSNPSSHSPHSSSSSCHRSSSSKRGKPGRSGRSSR